MTHTEPANPEAPTPDLDAIEAAHRAVEWQQCDDDGVPDLAKPLPTFCAACTDEEYTGAIEYGDTIDAAASVVSWPCETVELVAEIRRLAAARSDADQLRTENERLRDEVERVWCEAVQRQQLADNAHFYDFNEAIAERDAARVEVDTLRARAEKAEAMMRAVGSVLRNTDGDLLRGDDFGGLVGEIFRVIGESAALAGAVPGSPPEPGPNATGDAEVLHSGPENVTPPPVVPGSPETRQEEQR